MNNTLKTVESDNGIVEISLSGTKLYPTKDLHLISMVGFDLFSKNKDFIKDKIKDNWFVIIDPVAGTLLASPNQLKLFECGQERFPDHIFYFVGLLRESLSEWQTPEIA